MSDPITIVIVRALGLSGATWFNLVLGSHEEAMAMGPPARILDLPMKQVDHACFVHREHCDLWPAFLRQGDHRERFFKMLAAFTGKRVFIVNYPPKALVTREIEGQGFRVLHIRLVRDGRASLYSRMRHHGTLTPGTAIHHIVEWQIPVWDRVDRKMPDEPKIAQTVRYEDVVQHPQTELARIGAFIGLDYAENATRFWEYPHHLTAGNTGVLDTLCQLKGELGHTNRRAQTYARLAGTLARNPEHKYLDESWIDGLAPEDKIAFDCLLGERNARYGYDRDLFGSNEREVFRRNLDLRIADARSIEEGASARAAQTAQPAQANSGLLKRVLPFLRRAPKA